MDSKQRLKDILYEYGLYVAKLHDLMLAGNIDDEEYNILSGHIIRLWFDFEENLSYLE